MKFILCLVFWLTTPNGVLANLGLRKECHMSTAANETQGFLAKVGKLDNKLPLIVIGLITGAMAYTLGEKMGTHAHHALHHKAVHFVGNDLALWFFFAFLGLEISISSVLKAGKFAEARRAQRSRRRRASR